MPLGLASNEGLGRTARLAACSLLRETCYSLAYEGQRCNVDRMPCTRCFGKDGVPVKLEDMAATVRCEVLPRVSKARGDTHFAEVPDLASWAMLPGAKITVAHCADDPRFLFQLPDCCLRNRFISFDSTLHELNTGQRMLEHKYLSSFGCETEYDGDSLWGFHGQTSRGKWLCAA